METIVRHYAGDVSLDKESLRSLAQSLGGPQDDRDQSGPPRNDGPDSHHSGYLETADEGFTVQPVADNITRELTHKTALGFYTTLTPHRLFWRVLALELLHAYQAMD